MDSIRDFLRPAATIPSNLSFVPANFRNPVHAAAIVSLLNQYAQEPMGIGRPLPDEVKRRVVAGLRAHPTSFAYLAFGSKEPVGLVVCFTVFSTFQARPVVNIHDLYVKKSYRGRRIGRELLRLVEGKGRRLRCSKITLEVRSDNERALRLYESDGFDGERTRDGRPRTFFLEKSLGKRLRKPPS